MVLGVVPVMGFERIFGFFSSLVDLGRPGTARACVSFATSHQALGVLRIPAYQSDQETEVVRHVYRPLH